MKLAVLGMGRIGKIHLSNLLFQIPETEVLAVVDPDPIAQNWAASQGIKMVLGEVDPLLEQQDLDAVVICTPSELHAKSIKQFARAGKHIFCEKPLDLSIPIIQEVGAVLEECGVRFMLGFNRRFDPDFARIENLVREGKIGDPHILKITSRDPGLPSIEYLKGSGGMFLDQAIHDFDMARFIVGKEVVEVYARAAVRVDPAVGEIGDIDTAISSLLFEDGTMATIDNSRQAMYGYDQRLEIFGSKGMAELENHRLDRIHVYSQSGSQQNRLEDFFLTRYRDSYLNEMKHFVEAFNQDKAMPVGLKDGLQATAIGLAAGLSARENRPVKISEIIS